MVLSSAAQSATHKVSGNHETNKKKSQAMGILEEINIVGIVATSQASCKGLLDFSTVLFYMFSESYHSLIAKCLEEHRPVECC